MPVLTFEMHTAMNESYMDFTHGFLLSCESCSSIMKLYNTVLMHCYGL